MLNYLKTNNFLLIVLMASVVSCGRHAPVAQPQAVADKSYLLSFTSINADDGNIAYHFQVCRQASEAEQATTPTESVSVTPESAISAATETERTTEATTLLPAATETETTTETSASADAAEQVCFNPFQDKEGKPLVFEVLPEMDNLAVKGVAGKVLRYALEGAIVVAFGAIAVVLVPKAARLAFTKLFKMHKMSLSEYADDVVRHMARRSAKKSADKAQKKALKKGNTFTKNDHKAHEDAHYARVLQEKKAAFNIISSKPALFFISLFIAAGTIEGWKYSYEGWNFIHQQLKKRNWGHKELELAAAYPFLAGNEGEPHRVDSVMQLLTALQDGLDLVFSDDYLHEFDPPEPKSEGVNGL